MSRDITYSPTQLQKFLQLYYFHLLINICKIVVTVFCNFKTSRAPRENVFYKATQHAYHSHSLYKMFSPLQFWETRARDESERSNLNLAYKEKYSMRAELLDASICSSDFIPHILMLGKNYLRYIYYVIPFTSISNLEIQIIYESGTIVPQRYLYVTSNAICSNQRDSIIYDLSFSKNKFRAITRSAVPLPLSSRTLRRV